MGSRSFFHVPVTFVTIIAIIVCIHALQTTANGDYVRVPSKQLRNALRRVRFLHSTLLCKSSGSGSCSTVNAATRLPQALDRLTRISRNERKSLRFQPPSYPTTIIEPYDGRAADSSLIILHGFGGNREAEIENFLQFIKCGILPRTRIIIPQAYKRYNKYFNTDTRPSWFDLPLSRKGAWPDDEIFAAAGNISSIIDTVSLVTGISRQKSGLIGRSHGGALGTTVYLRHFIKVGVILVGFLAPPDNAYPNHMTSLSNNSPLLMINAELDDLVPISEARFSFLALTKLLHRNVTFREIEGAGHNLGDRRDELNEDSLNFVRQGLGRSQSQVNRECVDVDPPMWEFK